MDSMDHILAQNILVMPKRSPLLKCVRHRRTHCFKILLKNLEKNSLTKNIITVIHSKFNQLNP